MQQLKPEDVFIHAMEMKITTYCSLQCRDCTHLIPYVNTQRFASVEKMLSDLDKLLDVSKEWKSLGGYEKRDYTEEEVKKLYRVYHGKIYLHLHHGHLYHCYRVPCLNEEIYEKPVVSDYLDVRGTDTEELAGKLRSYIDDTQYMQGCYHCGGFHTCSPSIPPAVQLKRGAK